MRAATLLLCLGLTGCAGGALPGEQAVPTATAAATEVAGPPASRAASGGGGGARGGATTAAARAEPVEVPPDVLTQARVDCWMMVEHQKGLRGIEQRITFVDKCVAEQIKSKPSP